MNVKKVGNVILAVKDLEKSVNFYHNILGMPIKNTRSIWIDLGQSGALLSLRPASAELSIPNDMIMIGFVIGDVESAVNELKSKNVNVDREIQTREAGKNAIIRDPDGYMISLFEPNFTAEKNIQSGGYIGFTPA